MKVCSDIKRRIDEADQPDQLGLEITQHTALCAACREFAAQRTLLRGLITARARVNAPVNFDAMLNARLAEIKRRKSFAWFNSTVYMRFGAATAAIVVAICAAQYSNLLATDQSLTATIPQALRQTMPPYTPLAATLPPPLGPTVQPGGLGDVKPSVSTPVAYNAARNSRRYATTHAPLVADNPITLDDGSVIIVRSSTGEREVPIQTVSVGAQPLLYGNAGRQPAAVRPISVSF